MSWHRPDSIIGVEILFRAIFDTFEERMTSYTNFPILFHLKYVGNIIRTRIKSIKKKLTTI